MSVRHVLLASVCTAFLAATAAASGAAAAPATALEHVNEGYRLLAGGNPADAISVYSEAIESRDLQPDVLAGALLNRGLAHQQIGEQKLAIDDYTAALRIDALGPKLRATALYNRGLAFQQVGRPALAIEDYTSALLLDAQFSHAYYNRGNALRDSGQLLFALNDYDKAIQFKHPQLYAVYYSKGVTLAALKRDDEAKQALMKALDAKPDYDAARKKLAELGLPVPDAPPAVAVKAPDPEPAVIEAAITGSTSKPSGGQVVEKTYQPPAAVAPPSNLISAEAAPAPRKKLYTDRVPELAPDAQVAPAAVAKAPAAAEKVVAIEAVPDDPPTDEPAAETADTAPATADAEDETSAPLMKGWAVQLSSQRDEKVAWNVWGKMKTRLKMLEDQKPVVVKADLGTRGIFYRLRLSGFDDQSSAKNICSKLKSRGVSCFVSKIDG